MQADQAEPLSLLIAAVGGQGGNLLTEWIAQAASLDDLPIQTTSIPGVAQRTGSTIYYVEIFPVPFRDLDDREPVFSLYPVPGQVDAVMVPELLEAGRTIQRGYVSPSRTTVVASTHRVFSIQEKMPVGTAVYDSQRLEAAARQFSRTFIGFDALALARERETEVNAILLGALAASEVLPVRPETFVAAIEQIGVAPELNVRGFHIGYEHVKSGRWALRGARVDQEWESLKEDRAASLTLRRGPAFRVFVAEVEGRYPSSLRGTLTEAIHRLLDYQDERYASRYLEDVGRVHALATRGAGSQDGVRLTEAFAKNLAVWMSYEDAIRVADLKTRRGRFARIRQQMGVRDGQVLALTDYLKPDLDEIYGILPHRLVAPLARWAERRWPQGRPTLPQHVKTLSLLGFLRIRALALLRPLRPYSHRFHLEHALIRRYVESVESSAALDTTLACEVARAAQMVKGYGAVRRRCMTAFRTLVNELLPQAMELDRTQGKGYELSRGVAERTCSLSLQDTEGADPTGLARQALERARSGDRAGALHILGTNS
ncbi:MAG: indolepyruvate oxidoreductase subunit beta family protein [Candidatus Methylomirabilia bacterium]